MMGVPVTAYECRRCPGEAFYYAPGNCRRCDYPLFVMGAVA
jgi:ribosomal protein L37E